MNGEGEATLTAALADQGFTAALDAGDPAAHARLAELNRAAYGRSWNPASSGSPLAPPAEHAKAEITRLGRSREFLAQLDRGDPAALERWAHLHQAAHPEPGGPDPDLAPGPGAGPAGPTDPGDRGVPPGPEHYVVPGGAGDQLEAAARHAFHDLGLSVAEGAAIAEAWNQALADAEHRGPDAMARTTLARLAAEPDGERVLADARAVFRLVQLRHPALAEAILAAEVGGSYDFLRQLAALRPVLR